MTSPTNIRVVAQSIAALLVGMFALALTAEVLVPGSLPQQLTALAFGVATVLILPLASLAIIGFMWVAWRQAESSRFILEIPTKNGPRYYAQVPANQKATLLVLNEEDIHGVEVGSDAVEGSHVRRTPENRPIYVRADLPLPTALRSDELLHAFFQNRGRQQT